MTPGSRNRLKRRQLAAKRSIQLYHRDKYIKSVLEDETNMNRPETESGFEL